MALASIIGYLYLVSLFARSLLYPYQNLHFLLSIGPVLFITELIAVHAAAKGKDLKDNLKLTFFLLVFLIPVYSISRSWSIVFVTIISTIAKTIFKISVPSPQYTLYSVLIYWTTFFIIFLSPIWNLLFPNVPQGRGKGLIPESPETMMVWGVVYFSLFAALEIYLFYQSRKRHAK